MRISLSSVGDVHTQELCIDTMASLLELIMMLLELWECEWHETFRSHALISHSKQESVCGCLQANLCLTHTHMHCAAVWLSSQLKHTPTNRSMALKKFYRKNEAEFNLKQTHNKPPTCVYYDPRYSAHCACAPFPRTRIVQVSLSRSTVTSARIKVLVKKIYSQCQHKKQHNFLLFNRSTF